MHYKHVKIFSIIDKIEGKSEHLLIPTTADS
jgi:hypothetical protein